MTSNSARVGVATLLLLAGSSCAAVKAAGIATLDCSAAKIAPLVPSATTTVLDILAKSANAEAELDALAATAGLDVVECAVAAAVAQLEAKANAQAATEAHWGRRLPPPMATGGTPVDVQLARAYAWQAAHPSQVGAP